MVFGWCVGFGSGWCFVCPCFWIFLWYGLPKKLSEKFSYCQVSPFLSLSSRSSSLSLFLSWGPAGVGVSSLCRASFFWCEAPPTRVWRLEGLASRSFLPPSSSLCSPLPPCRGRSPLLPAVSSSLSSCLSVSFSLCLSLFSFSLCLAVCLLAGPLVILFVGVSLSVSVCLCLSVWPSFCLFVVCLFVRPFVPLVACLFVCLSPSPFLSPLSLSLSFLHALGQSVCMYVCMYIYIYIWPRPRILYVLVEILLKTGEKVHF